MPRVTIKDQYDRRSDLFDLWVELPDAFQAVRTSQRTDLMRWYNFWKIMSFEQFKEHAFKLGEREPSLAAAVGKSYQKVMQVFRVAWAQSDGNERLVKYYVRSLVCNKPWFYVRRSYRPIPTTPEEDIKRLARAVLSLAIQKAEEARERMEIDRSTREGIIYEQNLDGKN